MARVPLRFVGPSRDGRSLIQSAERTVNFLLEVTGEGKTATAALIGSAGLELFADLGDSPTRGHHVFKGRLFATVGKEVYEVYADGTSKRWGEIPSTSGSVGMSDNNGKIVIADGAGLFVLDLTTGTLIETLVEGVTPIASSVAAYIDGYTLALVDDSGEVLYSNLLDPATFSGLDFFTAESQIDNAVSLLVLHEEVQVLGTDTIEPWIDSGGSDNAFARREGGIAERGCGSAHGAFKIDNSFVWVGDTPIIWRMVGYTPVRISNHQVENALGKVDLATVTGFAFEEEGHAFGQWAIGNTSWVYDVTTGAWTERAWTNPATGKYERHRAEWCARVFGGNYVGDYQSGKIYRQALDVHADGALPLRRSRRFRIDNPRHDYLTVDAIGFTMEVGVGLDGDPDAFGADPMIALRMSFDGGRNWGSWDETSIGRIGETAAVAMFTRCGSGLDPVAEVASSVPVKLVLTGAWADVS